MAVVKKLRLLARKQWMIRAKAMGIEPEVVNALSAEQLSNKEIPERTSWTLAACPGSAELPSATPTIHHGSGQIQTTRQDVDVLGCV
jgi:hypothetical protein